MQRTTAKTKIEIARTQDDEVGDGTTPGGSLAAERRGESHQFLE